MVYTKEEAKKGIAELVEKYKRIVEEGRWGNYDEANTRRNFIEPLFHHLGWDVYNESKTDEVTEEERVSRGKVDYAFRISGVPKFFLEAKGIREDLDIPKWVEQAINYSWHKGITWAVLSDFEGTKVFNAERIAKYPDESLFFELKWDQYLERFDQLWLLSKENLEKGELDKEAEKWLKKRRKAPVSQKMLSDFIQWRQKLTRSIRKHPRLNKISDEELDESVQRILDRLIFIRISEDRGMEKNHLLSALREWEEKPKGKSLSQRLKEIFRDFDKGYNSKIFSPHISEDLVIDDEVLEEIINGLYETKDKIIRYDFSAVGADVLGNIYEQYLGHILKETPKRAKIVPSKVHRKERGIYYTPTYIVDYIVKNTLGELLKKTKPNKAYNIKVLDPACGSGSFLIRVFDEFVGYYQKHIPGEFGYLRKIEILKNNIYGVDLDRQAVEISQMNLLLKTLYRRQQLPMLKNIKQGNSLISGGEEELKPYFGDKWQEKCPFNWEEEFSEVFKQGGFDVIIGNPPYLQSRNIADDERYFYWNHYLTDTNHSDIFSFFIQRAISLLKNNGYLGFILPVTWLQLPSFLSTRKFILDNCTIEKISTFDSNIKVFQDAAVEPLIMIIKKLVKPKHTLRHEKYFKLGELPKCINEIPQESFRRFYTFDLSSNIEKDRIISRILKMSLRLPNTVKIVGGLRTGDDSKYLRMERQSKDDRKLLRGRNISRYSYTWTGEYVWYRPDLMKKRQCAAPKDAEFFEVSEKLLVRMIAGKEIISTYDNKQFYLLQDNLLLPKEKNYNIKYVLAILNSTLISFFLKNIASNIAVTQSMLRQLPVCKINFSNPTEKKVHDDLVKLADKMLDLNKELVALGDKITDRRHQIESEIQKTDNKIDKLVYKLYGITDEEQKIIEKSLK